MIKGLIGRKIGMTQIFDKAGYVIPVTIVKTGPCTILGLKDAPVKVILGFESVKETKIGKPRAGLFKKLGVSPLGIIREFASTDNKDYKVGQEIKADLFKRGDAVDVTAKSIGKGFQGGMKRWNWAGGPAAHGSMHHRRVGAIGSSTDPGRTLRGTNMPGHMGDATVTVQGLRIMEVDSENNLILIKGAIPGHSNSIVSIRFSIKKKFRDIDKKPEVMIHKVNPMKQSKKAKATGKK